jgi:hypothetical protein
LRNIGIAFFVLGLAVLIGSWITILQASFWLSAVIIPIMSVVIFFACIVTGAGSVMIDCPDSSEKVGWFSGLCLLLSAATLYYITGLSWYGYIFQLLGAVLMIAVMAVGGVLCLAPFIRAHFFPAVEHSNYTISRGACLVLMLSAALVAIYTVSTSDWEDFEFTALNGILLANVMLAFGALFFSGWMIPAVAIALVIMECAFTGSIAIVAKSFNLVFLVGIIAKIAYLCFSLQKNPKAYLHRGISLVKFPATVSADQ